MRDLKKLNPIDILAILFIFSFIAVIILEYFKIDLKYVLDLKYIKFSITSLLQGPFIITFIVVCFLVLTPLKFDDLALMQGFDNNLDSIHRTAYKLSNLCFFTQAILLILISVPSDEKGIHLKEVLFQFFFYVSPTFFFLFTTLFLKHIKK
jgi:ethanolamine transporter EutH